jgi:lysophospholipase L1-like esterase
MTPDGFGLAGRLGSWIMVVLVGACGIIGPRSLAAPVPVKTEPTNAAEQDAQAKKVAADAEVETRYQALVASLQADEQAWERVLQANLGGFYLPIHKRDRVAGRSTAWDFVRDDPALPRVLLVGDSVSRGYTQAARRALAGKANVHRAPANCGGTAAGLKNIDAWLASAGDDERWDVIHFNFGIHDRNTAPTEYVTRLEQLVERMRRTGARLIWASTTPIPDNPATGQTALSIAERNAAAAALMQRLGVPINDLFAQISPHLDAVQPPLDVHFKTEGYEMLGKQVADAIMRSLDREQR